MTESSRNIVRLVGVYDAVGTVRGELAYWFGKRLGPAHGNVRERRDWQQCRGRLPVPFDTYHRDDQPAAVRLATGDRAPAVLAETDKGLAVLVGPEDLEGCGGSPERLLDAITLAATQQHLAFT